MAKIKVTENELKGEIIIRCDLLADEETMKLVSDNEPEAKIIPLRLVKDNDEQV